MLLQIGIALITLTTVITESDAVAEIIPVDDSQGTRENNVFGYKSCGGKGKIVKYFVESCNSSSVCKLSADKSYRASELEFIAGENSIAGDLGISIKRITADGKVTTVSERAAGGRPILRKGVRYVSSSSLVSGESVDKLKGQRVTYQYSIFRMMDKITVVCVQAGFDVV